MVKNSEKEISSIDIMEKTGISRATLNNYIKMGLLPHPIVRKPDNNTNSRAKQIGYFPYSVMDTVSEIIQYKKLGHRMAEIRKLLAKKPLRSTDDVNYCEPAIDTGKVFFQKHVPPHGNESEELFSFDETHSDDIFVDTATKRDPRTVLRQGALTLVHFSVLVAEIQNTAKMCAELLPNEYIAFIRKIWKSITLTFKKYYGIYGKHTGHGVVFYFLKEGDSSYLTNSIVCALELRETIERLGQERKISGGGFDDLYLNIGISEGHEFLGTIPAAPVAECISLGEAVNTAHQLSDWAHSGSIWTTKNLLNLFDDKDSKLIRYGIYRKEQNRDILVENVFSRVMDLTPPNDQKYSNKYFSIWTIPVTEIQNLR